MNARDFIIRPGHESCAHVLRNIADVFAEAQRRGVPLSVHVEQHEEPRTLDQNAALWARLGEISRQVDWYGKRLTPEEWKHVFVAGLNQLKVVPGIHGGFVTIGGSTSRMSKRMMSDLLELVAAFAAERGVIFQETTQ